MLIIFTIVLFIVFLMIAFKCDRCCSEAMEAVGFFSAGAAIILSIVVVIMSIIGFVNTVGLEGKIAECDARYDSLVYQLENNLYDNDNDLGKRELYVDIQDWNEDLAWYKANQDDFWIGVFIPNIYDEFEFIELK